MILVYTRSDESYILQMFPRVTATQQRNNGKQP